MNSIAIGFDPVLFHLGNFALYWYSIAVATGVLVAVWIAVREARRRGIPEDEMYSLAFWTVLAGFLGARLFHVVDRLDYYWEHPGSIFALQQGGLAIWGGLGTGFLAGVIYSRIRKLPLLRLADAVAPAMLIGQSIGRIGCTINGDAYGGITDLPWAFVYTHPNAQIPSSFWNVPTHPYPIYEMLWNLAVLSVLLWMRRRQKIEGTLFFTYLSLYSLGRFFLTFVRQEKEVFWGLQQAQVLALITLAVSLIAWGILLRRREVRQV